MAKKGKPTGTETQRFIDIAEIKENVVVLKDGTLRGVLLVPSVNFALKSEIEQDALIAGYRDLINSLEYPVQVVIQSRKLNLEQYIQSLRDLEKVQQNELLKAQMVSYREFIKEILEIGQIMTKRFYVVVPFSPYSRKQKSFFTKLKEVLTPGQTIKVSQKFFEQYRKELETRMGQVQGSLVSLGLGNVQQIDTRGLIELYYNAYNPISSAAQPLKDTDQLRVETNF